MNLDMEQLSIVAVLLEGLLSFFSPCVVPLLPLYMGYLSGNAKTVLSDGKIVYNRGVVLLQTLCFMAGISLSFVILGLAFTSLGQLLEDYEVIFQIVAGVMIIVLGLYQLGILKLNFLNQEKRINVDLPVDKMNPFIAFLLGFLFSFTWTPCVSPALTSILLLTSTSSIGYLYVLVYAIGFVVPFLLLGLFTSQVLNFLKDRKKVLPTVVKIGAIILLVMGSYSLYQGVQTYSKQQKAEQYSDASFPQFTLETLNGKEYSLYDYDGKVIFMNFWTTWCGYCQMEVEELKEIHNMNDKDLQILSILVVTDETEEELKAFLKEKDLPYPVLIDYNGVVASQYGVNSYPRSFVIKPNYEMLGYIPGYVSKDVLLDVIEQAKIVE